MPLSLLFRQFTHGLRLDVFLLRPSPNAFSRASSTGDPVYRVAHAWPLQALATLMFLRVVRICLGVKPCPPSLFSVSSSIR